MIRIQNIYYMLSYAFQVLNEQGYKQLATEEFDNVAELCAAILIKGVSLQIKRGLGKEYVLQTEPLSALRGKIDISASVKEQSMLKKQLVCNYDEFSVNSYMNRIIRTTMDTLVRSSISKDRKKQLRKLLIYFSEVEPLSRESINWKLQFNKNNQTYQIRVFPRTLSNTNTSLVLKTPKTKTSVRKIFLPSTVAQMLLERKKQIDEMKELFGDEYLDYDLVFCHSSGRPMEGQVINRALKKLIQDNDLPDVVFHSFRHASITYKLKWNGGDMKSVQGDSGHARMDMVADVYSHIIDEDRRYNAQKFEEQFYNAKGLKNAEEGKTAPMPKFETSVELLDPMAEVQKGSEVEEEKPAENSADENAALLAKLLSNPDTAALLKALAKTI